MSAISLRNSPFLDPFRLHDSLNRFFADEALPLSAAKAGSWSPAVDIYEEEGAFVLRAELPGIEPEEVELSVENNVLSLKGERRLYNEENRDNYRRIERSYGSFSRSFKLPKNVDVENVSASSKNGVLSVRLPLKEESKPRQIAVKVEDGNGSSAN